MAKIWHVFRPFPQKPNHLLYHSQTRKNISQSSACTGAGADGRRISQEMRDHSNIKILNSHLFKGCTGMSWQHQGANSPHCFSFGKMWILNLYIQYLCPCDLWKSGFDSLSIHFYSSVGPHFKSLKRIQSTCLRTNKRGIECKKKHTLICKNLHMPANVIFP